MCAAWLAMPTAQTPATDVPLGDPASFRVDKASAARQGSIGGAHRSRDGARPTVLPPAGARLVVPDLQRIRRSALAAAGGGRPRRRTPRAVRRHGRKLRPGGLRHVGFRPGGRGPGALRRVAARGLSRDAVGLRRRCCHRGLLRRLSRGRRSPGRAHAAGRRRAPPPVGPSGTGNVAAVGRHADEAVACRPGSLPARRLGTLHRPDAGDAARASAGVLSPRARR